MTYSFRPYHGPGVDSTSSENAYQEYFWGERRPGPKVDNLTTFMCRMWWKSGSLNLLEPSGPHWDCYWTGLPFFYAFWCARFGLKMVQRKREETFELLVIFTDIMCVDSKVAIRVELWALLSTQQEKQVEHLEYVGKNLMLTLSGRNYGGNLRSVRMVWYIFGSYVAENPFKIVYKYWLLYTDMRRLTTGIRSENWVVRRFRRCAKRHRVYLHKSR